MCVLVRVFIGGGSVADGQEGLFAAVDALLEKAAETALPNSAERKRLREAEA
jgi:hypothetical protein